MKSYPLHLLVLFLLLVSLVIPFGMAAGAAQPVVQAVLFFSPSCGHCQNVIQEDLPPLLQKYGDQLQVAGIDVTGEYGQQIYQAALAAYQVPDDRLGVPALYLGSEMLLGDREIPEKLPGIVDAALATGGLGWAQIPGLEEAIAAGRFVTFEGQQGEDFLAQVVSDTTNSVGVPVLQQPASSVPASTAQEPDQPTWRDKFMHDPVGNSIAVILLVVMLVTVVSVAYGFVAATPGVDDEDENTAAPAQTTPQSWRRWAILLLALAGLGISIYLSYIEISQREAVCGPIGDCNSVQRSPYAMLFGVLPVAILGAAGYTAILIALLVQWLGPATLRRGAAVAIWVMAFLAVLFTIYLTFLEPFVIGSTCIWCISSAIVITALLWISTGPAKEALS